jgi:predicted enzyme related to lactoylglutathione lyase
MYYWALETPDLDRTTKQVVSAGAQVIREDRNSEGGRSAWLHPRSTHGVLTELIERK